MPVVFGIGEWHQLLCDGYFQSFNSIASIFFNKYCTVLVVVATYTMQQIPLIKVLLSICYHYNKFYN